MEGLPELSQQPRFLLRQSASDHLLRHLLLCLSIKLVTFGKLALIQLSKGRSYEHE
jgi:hypothetical protein